MKKSFHSRIAAMVFMAEGLVACGPAADPSLVIDNSDSSQALVGGAAASTTTFPAVGKFEQVAFIPTAAAVPTANVKVGSTTYPLLCVPGDAKVQTITGVDGVALPFCMGSGPTVAVSMGTQTIRIPSGQGTPLAVPFAGCTGTMIAHFGSVSPAAGNILVLTAGHCVVHNDQENGTTNNLMNPNSLRFSLAPNGAHTDTLVFAGVHVHAAFNLVGTFEGASEADIAVVEMRQLSGSNYRPAVDPLYFDRGSGFTANLAANTAVTVVGFGITSAGATNYGTMRNGTMAVVNYDDNFVNLKAASTTTTCNGDSGGPNYVAVRAPNSSSTSTPVRYVLAVTSQGAANCTAGKTATAYQSLANPADYTFVQN